MMEVPVEKLKSRVYNVTAMSFTPAQLVEEMKRYYPQLTVEYEPDSRQQIGTCDSTTLLWYLVTVLLIFCCVMGL